MNVHERLIVHIGAPKTGTTALQRFLEANRKTLLEEQGIHVPRHFASSRVRRLSVYAAAPNVNPRSLALLGLTPDGLDTFCRNFCEDTRAALNVEHRFGIISSELLFALKPDGIIKLRQLLSPHYRRISILLYIRRQDLRAVSLYAQSFKRGNERLLFPPFPEESYRTVIQQWQSAFGRENLILRIYERERLPQNDIVLDFFEATGLSLPVGCLRPAASNPTWGQAQMAVARLLDREFQSCDPYNRTDVISRHKALISFVEQLPAGDALQVSRDEARAYLNQWNEENEWLHANFFQDDSELFNADFGMYADKSFAPNFELTTSEWQSVVKALWDEYADLNGKFLAAQEQRRRKRVREQELNRIVSELKKEVAGLRKRMRAQQELVPAFKQLRRAVRRTIANLIRAWSVSAMGVLLETSGMPLTPLLS